MCGVEKKERNAKILALRKAGKSDRYIGKLFGISHQAVCHICNRASKKDLPKVEPNSFRSALSGRLIYGLAEHFGGGLPGPVVIAEEGAYRLGLSYGVGSKSLQLLAKALYDYGYIDDPERWLAGK
jgi:hypothetical protein